MSHLVYRDNDTGEFISEADYAIERLIPGRDVEAIEVADLEDFYDDLEGEDYDVVDYDGGGDYGEE